MNKSKSAFTLIELLVIIAVIAILSAMWVPALANSKAWPQTVVCMNNTKQLMLANLMYQGDNNGKFPGVVHGNGTIGPNDPRHPWCSSWLDWNFGFGSFITNTAYLVDPRFSSLAAYFGNQPNLYHCPADNYVSPIQHNQGGWTARNRSYSANVYVGGLLYNPFSNPPGAVDIIAGPYDANYVVITAKASQMVNPGPASCFVYLDENADSINDGAYFTPWQNEWYDMPANYHNGAGSFSFADGHSEIHKWQDTALPIKIVYNNSPGWRGVANVSAGDRDYKWMREHTQHQ